MKLKFLRALIVALACLIVFLTTTFVPAAENLHQADFFRGFSIGAGVVALIAAIYYYLGYQKERNTIM
jgi:hypothetical protein